MEEYPLKWITPYLAVGYAPRSIGQLQSIHTAGIEAIVNLCAECYDLHEVEKEFNFEVCYLAVADEDAPTPAQMDTVISWLDLQRGMGKKVLVHCRYGIGRTGTVVLAYLLHIGMSFRKARKVMEQTPSWPSTSVQKKTIDEFIKKLNGDSRHTCFEETNDSTIGKFFTRLEAVLKWND